MFTTYAEQSQQSESPLAQILAMRGIEPIPMQVQLAFRFVQQCNEQMSPLHVSKDGNLRIVRRELNPQQERVFNLACLCLGQYFANGLDHAQEPTDGTDQHGSDQSGDSQPGYAAGEGI